jgi:glutamine synthetase type III
LHRYDEAVAKGLCRIDSGVEAMKRFTDPKNTELFEKMGVFTPRECEVGLGLYKLHPIQLMTRSLKGAW